MTDPIVFDNKPQATQVEAGKEYHWCSCGRSSSQAFCDGSHRGTTLTPKGFTAEDDSEVYLCLCKHTRNPPFCDGSHKKFTADEVGTAVAQTGGDQLKVEATPEEPTVVYIHDLAENGKRCGRY